MKKDKIMDLASKHGLKIAKSWKVKDKKIHAEEYEEDYASRT